MFDGLFGSVFYDRFPVELRESVQTHLLEIVEDFIFDQDTESSLENVEYRFYPNRNTFFVDFRVHFHFSSKETLAVSCIWQKSRKTNAWSLFYCKQEILPYKTSTSVYPAFHSTPEISSEFQ
jgi:hypothetical protein